MRERLFCSDAARMRGDDNAATASRIDVWILVELSATWGARPLIDAVMPDAVRSTLMRALEEIPRSRVVFIRRRFETRTGCRVYIVRSAPQTWTLSMDLPSIDEVAGLPFRTLARSTNPPPPLLPIVLVCTHGQRDSCCGRRGFPLYEALRHDQSLEVWQCSHIGGDRFAANAVVLPWGLYYGPVEPRDAAALSESIHRGEILLPAYRGRSSVPRLGQAAETFVRRTANILGRDALEITGRETAPDGRTQVQLRDDGGRLHEVTLEQYVSMSSALLTCTTKESCPIVQFRLVDYRVTSAPA
jgi:hypothetical protein